MQTAKIKVEYRPVKNFQGYGLTEEIEICFDTMEEHDQKVRMWQAKARQLVKAEMEKDTLKVKMMSQASNMIALV